MKSALTAACLMLITIGGAQAANQEVLEPFDYDGAAAAQAAWVPAENSLPVGLAEHDGGQALRLNADFTDASSKRAVYDKEISLDLSRWSRFSVQVYTEDPGLIGHFMIYLHSGDGWYGISTALARKGWTTWKFDKSGFRTEDHPAGWDKVDRIRLSAWRGDPRQGFCLVDNFTGYRDATVLVLDSKAQATAGEAATVKSSAQAITDRLTALGIDFGALTDTEAAAGELAGREFVFLPYNPNLPPAALQAVQTFVQGGGKVFACYQLQPALAELLGIKSVGWQRTAYEGQFAQIKLDSSAAPGLPAQVGQASWNITKVEPLPGGAKVLGQWYDSAGKDTGLAAMTLNDHGVFLTHVLLADDPGGKSRLLLAVLGKFQPKLWEKASQEALRGPEQIGQLYGLDAVRRWLAANVAAAADPAQAQAALADSERIRGEAAAARAAGRHASAVDLAQQADQRLRDAYALAQPSRRVEFRAWWNHSGTGLGEAGWPESMKNLHDTGFNAIVPNLLWGGSASYNSKVLPHAKVVAERGDQVKACVDAARPYGIQVHVWKVNWNLGWQAPKEWVDQLRAEGRLQVGFKGNDVAWLCPSDPRNTELEAASMIEVAQNYDVQGVHFDYIRYPDGDSCFCEHCRARFEQALGQKVANWPADVRTPALRDKWTQWRCDNISRLVQKVSEGVRRVKPGCQISAAVFSDYPQCREGVGQDWVYWIRQGWLDFVCPMDYTDSDTRYGSLLRSQMSYIQGRIPFYPGIGASASSSTLPADRVAAQIRLGRQLGADGFTIFNYDRGTVPGVAPGLGAGVLRQPATVPEPGPVYTFDLGELTSGAVYGRQAAAGATVSVAVKRGDDRADRRFGAVTAEVVVEDVNGREVAKLGPAPTTAALQATVTAPRGLRRVVVRGTAELGGRQVAFVRRSLPLLFGAADDPSFLGQD